MRGLTRAEVEERWRAGLDNREVKTASKTVRQIIVSNVFTYFNLIFVIIAVLLILVKSYRDLTFLPIIIANTLIGIIQELRAKQVLDNLKVMNMPRVVTLRDEEEQEIPVHELVKDDIVRLGAGNQVPADARIVQGDVIVNESLLTGEADEIKRKTGEDLMSGSFVVSGECYARLERVGKESYVSRLTLEARAMKAGEESEIIRSLNKIVRFAGVAIIPIGIILFCQQYFGEGQGMQESVQAMVAAVIGMIPEGLFLLASVTLVISAMKLAQKRVMLHDMKSIEALSRVDTLCVDKTGTITEERMHLTEIINLGGRSAEKNRELLREFVAAQAADNATMITLKEALGQARGRKWGEVQKVIGFSSKYKYSGVEFTRGAIILGAPEFVLGEAYGKYAAEIEQYGGEGYRVLVFGKYDGILDGKKLTGGVKPYGLVLLANAVRKDAARTFRYFYEQGVAIKVISGDNPVTVAKVAEQVGIQEAEKYIDCRELKGKKTIDEAVRKYTVFGRVTPEQKRSLIQALKRQGRTVAMTGDGVNDVLALKDADCSVAMASGSEVAVQVAQVVLLDSDFAKMSEIVREGRRVVNNLERSGSLFLVKNIFSLLTAMLIIGFGLTYPVAPAQVSLISMFTIGVPAFLLSQIPNTALIRGKFIRNIILRALPGGVTDVILVVAMAAAGNWIGIDTKEVGTVATILLAVVGMMVLYDISRPMDWIRRAIWWLSAAGLMVSVLFLKPLFGIRADLSFEAWWLLAGFALLAWPVLRGVKWLVGYLMKVRMKSAVEACYNKSNE